MESECNRLNYSIVFEPAARRLSIDHRPLDLTTAEYEILACLAHHAGNVVSREQLMRAAFGRTLSPLDRAVDVHISHLRKKLGQHRALIVTIRSVGYLLRIVLLAFVITPSPTFGAEDERRGTMTQAVNPSEDIEPRTVGGAGVASIGLSGFIDKFMSTEEVFPWHATAHVDITRFVSNNVAVRGGLIGSTSFGDEEDEDTQVTGPGARSLQALAGVAYYFTPQSMASLYAGGEYRAQLTDRADRDAGSVLGKGGIQAAISSRVAVFVEGGYGVRLTRGAADERQTRIVGELGFRIKF